jgi:hypothetical protein
MSLIKTNRLYCPLRNCRYWCWFLLIKIIDSTVRLLIFLCLEVYSANIQWNWIPFVIQLRRTTIIQHIHCINCDFLPQHVAEVATFITKAVCTIKLATGFWLVNALQTLRQRCNSIASLWKETSTKPSSVLRKYMTHPTTLKIGSV